MMLGVTTLILGISLSMSTYYLQVTKTAESLLSLALVFAHFFLVLFLEAKAALAIASLVFFYPAAGCLPISVDL